MMHTYTAVYHCMAHGEFFRTTTEAGHAGDFMKCPRCKEQIPLVRTEPFRDIDHIPGLKTK
jgi:hypothetical protein